MPLDPRTVYHDLIARRRAEVAAQELRHRRLGYVRLALAASAAVMVWAALAAGTFSIAWLLAPIAAFAALMVWHDRLLVALEHRRRAVRYFERALERLEGGWAGRGERGERYLDPAHPYAVDLDLFGEGSLFELLSTARTHIGEDTLARWLLAPAPPETVRARQQAVEELRPRLDLREDLAVLAEEARSGIDPVALAAWGESPALLDPGARSMVWICTAIGIAALAGFLVAGLDALNGMRVPAAWALAARYVFLFGLLANGFFLYRRRNAMDAVVLAVDEAAHELGLLSAVLVRVERERFHSPLLAELRASLDAEGDPPSRRLARLRRLTEKLDSRDNLFVKMLEVFILWTPRLTVQVEDWRRHSGAAVRRWLAAVGEMEALSSLASHAFEHPADPFPEFAEDACLEAEGVGHPLIPEDRVVRNDVRLSGSLQVLIVSGSNMSGKSTLLRTVGVNAVLAQAGAPVRARRLRLSALATGASIRVSDSLQGGVSRFYAEILRLRQILDLTGGPLPVLFLIDEVLHGTNSHDRRIGAQAVVRELAHRGALGLLTTHDLALAGIAETLDGRAVNVHFEDHIEGGRIHFDYVMRPGVVHKSNAIELMRSVGLEI
jgi:MutS-like protein